jgi:outer membrane protein assembly factor BamB
MLAFANERYVGVYGRREFSVLDAATGETLWVRRDVGPNAVAFGARDIVLIVPSEDGELAALRMSDGKPFEMPDAAETLSHTIHISSAGMLVLDNATGGDQSKPAVVRLYDPGARRDHWRLEISREALLGAPDGGWLPIFDPAGRLSMVDIESGAQLQIADSLPGLAADGTTELYVLQDDRNVYFAVCNRGEHGRYEFGDMASVPVSGPMYAFDRITAAQLWKVDVEGQHLIYERLRTSPVLVFAQREYRQKGDMHQGWVDLMCLNKSTGQKLVETELPMNSTFQSLSVNLREGYVELGSYDQRLRLLRE